MFRFLIADDHEIVRQRILQIVKDEFGGALVAEAADTNELIDQFFRGSWDIIISDIHMPGGGGLEALNMILGKVPSQAVILISTYDEDFFKEKLIKLGAVAYLRKERLSEELLPLLKQILLPGPSPMEDKAS